jgi:hypothetical protein
MCKVSYGELGVLDRCVDVGIETVERTAQTRSVCCLAREDGGKTRSQESV